MPYKAEEQNGEWVVVNTETEEVKAHHGSGEEGKDKAERQVKLLEMLEKERDSESDS